MSSSNETSLLNEKYIPDSLKWLLLVTLVLISLGAFNILSATIYMNMDLGVMPFAHLLNHVLYLAISLLAVLVLSILLTVKRIRNWAPYWVGAILVLLALVVVAGKNVNGATRWIPLGGFSLQPSEFAKVAAIIWTASSLAIHIDKHEEITLFARFFRTLGRYILFWKKKQDNIDRSFISMLAHFIPLGGPLAMAMFVLAQPDMGTAGMIVCFPVLLYILAGLPIKEIAMGICLVIVTFCYLLTGPESYYRWLRVMVMWDPFSYSQLEGYQIVQSLIAVGSGGILGQNGSGGMSKFLYLPEQYTDFAFAVFCQEQGFIGAFILIMLYVLFLCFGFATARQLKDTYAALLVYGLSMLISMQGLINMAMVVGCFPVTGIPLPFISYGGSSLLTNIIAVYLIYSTTVQTLYQADMEERRHRIDAMEGHSTSFRQLSSSVNHYR